MTEGQGLHLLVDAKATMGLDDPSAVRYFMRQAVALTGLELVHYWQQNFASDGAYGPGITLIAVLAESSLTLHTRSKAGLLNLDMFSCKDFDADKVMWLLGQVFGVTEILQEKRLRRF